MTHEPVPNPIAEPDDVALARFWERCLGSGTLSNRAARPDEVFAFGDHAALADELVELVVAGTKRATVGAVASYVVDDTPMPRVGDLAIVTDGGGVPRAVIRTTEVRVGPLSSVDEAFAWDEGEGERTRSSWLADHAAFFRRTVPEMGVAFDDAMATVFERFEVLYAE